MIINGTLQYKDEFAFRWMQEWSQHHSFVLDTNKPAIHLYLYAVQDINNECEVDLSSYRLGDKVVLVLPYEGSLKHLDQIFNKFINKYPNFPTKDLYLSTEILNYKDIGENKYNFLNLFAIDKWRKYSKFEHTHNFNNKIKDFLSYNRSPKHHRYQLIAELQLNNIIDNGYVSFNPNFNDEVPFMLTSLQFCETDPYLPNDKKELYKPYIQKTFWIDPYNIRLPQDSTQDELRTKRFLESRISVITESNWYEPEIFFTEKIYSAIAYKHAFILLAPPHSLQKLKDLGFKTFDGIIDESYDMVTNHYDRLQLVVQQIKNFCNLDTNTKHNIWIKLNDIAEYNFNYFWSNEYENKHSELLHFLKTYGTTV
jgi:hypothetical protein